MVMLVYVCGMSECKVLNNACLIVSCMFRSGMDRLFMPAIPSQSIPTHRQMKAVAVAVETRVLAVRV